MCIVTKSNDVTLKRHFSTSSPNAIWHLFPDPRSFVFTNERKISIIEFGEGFAKFVIPVSLFKEFFCCVCENLQQKNRPFQNG